MKTIKAILYSLYARVLWAFAGMLTGILAMYAMSDKDESFRGYLKLRWKK